MKVWLCGQKAFGAMVLERLMRMADVEIAGASSPGFSAHRTDSLGGPVLDRLSAAAIRHRLLWVESGFLTADIIRGMSVDLIVCAHSHDFLGRHTRDAATYGAIGYHPSLLPRHRGRDAVRWVVHMKEPVTGGTVYRLDQNVDAGPILAQRFVHVHPTDTAETLWREKLAPMGVSMLAEVVAEHRYGYITGHPQDESLATWEPSWSRPPLYRPELPRLGSAS